MPRVLLLSGPIASGKTSLADELIARHGFKRLRSSDHLKAVCLQQGLDVSRSSLQQLGDRLDQETDFRWLIDEVAQPQIVAEPSQGRWLIDSVRKERQVAHFRSTFGSDVTHVHVWASEEVLLQRFEGRRNSGSHSEGSTEYAAAISHPNEVSARALLKIADLAINLGEIAPRSAGELIIDHLDEGF